MGLLEIRSWRFLAPVLIGDTIHIVNEVTELRPTSKSDRGVMVHRVEVVKQDETIAAQGEPRPAASPTLKRRTRGRKHAAFDCPDSPW